MADLTLETYDVSLGTGPNDPAKAVWATGIQTLALAEKMRARYDELRAEGAFSPAIFAGGNTFFVEMTPGAQSRPSTATTKAELRAELEADKTGTLVLYARQQNAQNFIRVAAAPIAHVLKLDP